MATRDMADKNNAVYKNNALNREERNAGATILKSFPLKFGINISNICNQKCTFCAYDPKKRRDSNFLEPSFFEGMPWLRHINQVILFAGLGDPLVNPHFPRILPTVRKIAPYSELSLFTNGIALDGERLDAIIKDLDVLHISLNAYDEKVYNKIIHGGNYRRAIKNLETLSRRKHSKLTVETSIVLTKDNAMNLTTFVRKMVELGFERVVACNYVDVFNTGRDVSIKNEEHLYFDKDTIIDEAKKNGCDVTIVTDFEIPGRCIEPWTTAYITNDLYDIETGKMFQCCCPGILPNMFIEGDYREKFHEMWNNTRMQKIRATVNATDMDKMNTMCRLCKSLDRSKETWKQDLIDLSSTMDFKLNKWGGPIVFDKMVLP